MRPHNKLDYCTVSNELRANQPDSLRALIINFTDAYTDQGFDNTSLKMNRDGIMRFRQDIEEVILAIKEEFKNSPNQLSNILTLVNLKFTMAKLDNIIGDGAQGYYFIEAGFSPYLSLLSSLHQLNRSTHGQEQYMSWLCHLSSSKHMSTMTTLAYVLDMQQLLQPPLFCWKKPNNVAALIQDLHGDEETQELLNRLPELLQNTLPGCLENEKNLSGSEQDVLDFLEANRRQIRRIAEQTRHDLRSCIEAYKDACDRLDRRNFRYKLTAIIMNFALDYSCGTLFSRACSWIALLAAHDLPLITGSGLAQSMDRSAIEQEYNLQDSDYLRMISRLKLPAGREHIAAEICSQAEMSDTTIRLMSLLDLWKSPLLLYKNSRKVVVDTLCELDIEPEMLDADNIGQFFEENYNCFRRELIKCKALNITKHCSYYEDRAITYMAKLQKMVPLLTRYFQSQRGRVDYANLSEQVRTVLPTADAARPLFISRFNDHGDSSYLDRIIKRCCRLADEFAVEQADVAVPNP
jgi:hypothetical protein